MRMLDDLAVGDRFAGGPLDVTEADIFDFAGRFDPQPFHLDPAAAKESVFGGLAASGWHTAALTMRMIVDGEGQLAGGFVGLAVEELAWPKPVRPGDVLRTESEVLEIRPSGSRPDRGTVRMRTLTYNQNDEMVQRFTAVLLVQRSTGLPGERQVGNG
ncbi:MaoC family dehydratase [Skermanella mucosa]|uniref:MaoC family dehydratase n=1 Tax=Skermanella mucosa TaxID=1789672 RepID=UPI00192C27B4|nr:MaoC family dehydratase [Skermanella mucosa]UEM18822.1 MaoC family dehydratase [Skermanella mucosa]